MHFRLAITMAWSALALQAAAVSGEAVFQQRCAGCHDSGNPRVPPRDELKKLMVAAGEAEPDIVPAKLYP